MKKINFKEDVMPHGFAVIVFLIVTIFFFNPVFFDNRSISQHDIQEWAGSSKALRDYRDQTGKEGLWASSMFSGMPAYLINLDWDDGVIVGMKKVMSLFLPHPIANIFLAFISFYILLLSFRVRPYLAIAGALAFGLSSYMIIGLSAGHNARIGAIAFMPLVIAGIHLAFSEKRIPGFGVTAAGLALHLRESHLQITYYLILIVLGYGLMQLIMALREKQLNNFFRSLVVLVPAAVIAAATFFGQFWAVKEYEYFSTRGPSELTKPGQASVSKGLTKEYAFAYNYGIYEPMTLLLPQFYGGSSAKAFGTDQNSESYKALVQSGDNNLANQLINFTSEYWGPQDFTGGPYYGGAIIVFLFVIGIIFAERKYVWWLVSVGALGVMLSWGSSFPSFNYFMFDYFPGINKFRSVNFALIMILFAMPLLGMLGLERVLSENQTKQVKMKLVIAFGATGGLCLLLLAFAGMGSFMKEGDAQLPAWFLSALTSDREGLFRDDALRSLCFIFSIFILLYLNIPKKISPLVFHGFLILMITMDLSLVDKRYFTSENYQRKRDNSTATATAADEVILQDKSYYRVYNLQSSMSEANTSYFHNSLGGYHGAKIRRYQDLYDSGIYPQTRSLISDLQAGKTDFARFGLLNMLNAKYLTFGPEANNIIPNDAANGPAWFVKQIQSVNSPNEELSQVTKVNTYDVAVIDQSKFKVQQTHIGYDSLSAIILIEHKPDYLKYESQSSQPGLAVFSEIYYPKGWIAAMDGKETTILRANYVLRALEIPAGKHIIEFRFDPKPYVIGNKVTMASSYILLILVLGSIGWSLRETK